MIKNGGSWFLARVCAGELNPLTLPESWNLAGHRYCEIFYCPGISQSHSTARHAHAKRTCGPLLFVIGIPNVAALHWRGRWHKSSDLSYSQ